MKTGRISSLLALTLILTLLAGLTVGSVTCYSKGASVVTVDPMVSTSACNSLASTVAMARCLSNAASSSLIVGLSQRTDQTNDYLLSFGFAAVACIVGLQALSGLLPKWWRRGVRVSVFVATVVGVVTTLSLASWGSLDVSSPASSGFASFLITTWLVQRFDTYGVTFSIGLAIAVIMAISCIGLLVSLRNLGRTWKAWLYALWGTVGILVVPTFLLLEVPLLHSSPVYSDMFVITVLGGTELGTVLTNANLFMWAKDAAVLCYAVLPSLWLTGWLIKRKTSDNKHEHYKEHIAFHKSNHIKAQFVEYVLTKPASWPV